jgi:hypothetical protein
MSEMTERRAGRGDGEAALALVEGILMRLPEGKAWSWQDVRDITHTVANSRLLRPNARRRAWEVLERLRENEPGGPPSS